MKKRIVSLTLALSLALCALLVFVACAAPSDAGESAGAPRSYYRRPDSKIMPDVEYSFMTDGEGEGGDPADLPEEPSSARPQPGSITASAWNDNVYYDYYRSLFAQGEAADEGEAAADGRFYRFPEHDWHMDTSHRYKVTVTCDGQPVAGAAVTGNVDAESSFAGVAVTDANGVAYLFVREEIDCISVASGESRVTVACPEGDELEVTLPTCAAKKNTIQIMFVVDVTGSMGDELEYLKSEVGYVIDSVATSDAETAIQLALLFYRDDDDDQEFAYYDFLDVTDPANLQIQQGHLAAQRANGGGDYPEAVDQALALAVSKQWSEGAATKLIFHLLDAPAHDREAVRSRYAAAVESARAQGIRICPILASGADTLTEYLTRQEAILTGGTFIYVTDDSGIGGSHYDPDIPNAVVEYLNALMVRVIVGYHTGTFAEPVAWNAAQD